MQKSLPSSSMLKLIWLLPKSVILYLEDMFLMESSRASLQMLLLREETIKVAQLLEATLWVHTTARLLTLEYKIRWISAKDYLEYKGSQLQTKSTVVTTLCSYLNCYSIRDLTASCKVRLVPMQRAINQTIYWVVVFIAKQIHHSGQ